MQSEFNKALRLTNGFRPSLVVAGFLFGLQTLISCGFSGTHSGTVISIERARQVVVEQHQTLQRVVALAERPPFPTSDDPACRSLATELGALDIRFENKQGGPCVRIAYSRGGLSETYETQLVWVTAETAECIRAGRDRLGESFEYLDHGWWWVVW